MRSKETIIYINFAPYENAGKILDYILTRFHTVLVFSFNFHRLGVHQKPSTLRIYREGKIIKHFRLIQTPTTPQIAFLLLPIRSLIIFLQIIFHAIRLHREFGPYDIYFTVNAFTAWSGNILRRIGIVKKTIFWVWDYYPPIDKSKIVMFMRWMYWQFDKLASHSDSLIFLNHRLERLRKKINILPLAKSYPIVGIGTKIINIQRNPTFSLLFIGVLKQSQGLDLILSNTEKLFSTFPAIALHIIGSGPDEDYFKKLAQKSKMPIYFHGLLDVFSVDAKQIIKKTAIGIAPYKPERGNVSYFGDPAKIKNYIGYGLPVITTNVFEFAKEIKKTKSGIVIPYNITSFIRALKKINADYSEYASNSYKLSKKYNYTKYYNLIFKNITQATY
ncbi:MAG: Glycosyltransferase [Microgenomates group bacterium GW2011_GWA2_47_8]|nr:MAG: Glycosyltransferase [Microgenomates group bacterium GW2011_GWA2_47_8]